MKLNKRSDQEDLANTLELDLISLRNSGAVELLLTSTGTSRVSWLTKQVEIKSPSASGIEAVADILFSANGNQPIFSLIGNSCHWRDFAVRAKSTNNEVGSPGIELLVSLYKHDGSTRKIYEIPEIQEFLRKMGAEAMLAGVSVDDLPTIFYHDLSGCAEHWKYGWRNSR